MSITSTATIDSQLAELLTDLSDTQHELLTLLGEKRSHLMTANLAALAKLQPHEEAIVVRLKGCQDKRAARCKRPTRPACRTARFAIWPPCYQACNASR